MNDKILRVFFSMESNDLAPSCKVTRYEIIKLPIYKPQSITIPSGKLFHKNYMDN